MTQFNLGYRTVCEAIGHGGSAASAIQSLAHCANQSSTADIFSGAVCCVVKVYQSIKANNLPIPTFKEKRFNDFLQQPPATMSTTLSANLTLRHKDAGPQVGSLCLAIDQYQGRISFNDPVANNAVEQPAEPIKPSGPIEVVVVGMVTRETSTEVTRDGKGQIESTQQIERDLRPST